MGSGIFKDDRLWAGFKTKRFVLGAFRFGTLVLGVGVEQTFDAEARTYLPILVVSLFAVLYTGFKLILPYRWYRQHGVFLIIVDILTCGFILIAHRDIHSGFIPYTLNPVLTSALLFGTNATWKTAGATAAYFTLNFFSFPLADSIQEHLSSVYFIYLMALGLTAWLPYVVNSQYEQRLKSETISEERLKLGREIHDGLSQTLYGLRLQIQMLQRNMNPCEHLDEKVASLEGLLDKAQAEARGSIELLRSFRVNRPFLPQIEDSLSHLKCEFGIDYRLEADDGEPRLDELTKIEMLHVCEEALMNVAKHSGASQVTVRIREPNGHFQMSIADDGHGIARDGLSKGNGLSVMKERAEALGGNCRVISVPGAGTEILVEAPRKWS